MSKTISVDPKEFIGKTFANIKIRKKDDAISLQYSFLDAVEGWISNIEVIYRPYEKPKVMNQVLQHLDKAVKSIDSGTHLLVLTLEDESYLQFPLENAELGFIDG